MLCKRFPEAKLRINTSTAVSLYEPIDLEVRNLFAGLRTCAPHRTISPPQMRPSRADADPELRTASGLPGLGSKSKYGKLLKFGHDYPDYGRTLISTELGKEDRFIIVRCCPVSVNCLE
uniref:SFRICE_035407 n=1 Tax=Spodoptera frugiperda TaxID=7108 RepID=A0A2H1VIC6_SPOFR